MVELKFLKLEMHAVAFDVEKIPRRTQVLETLVPPFFFSNQLFVFVIFFFFPCFFSVSQTI